jgi:hypothetical protein
MTIDGATRFSLPVQSNSVIAEFDMFSAEIGQVRFRMEEGVGETGTDLVEARPTLPSSKTGRDKEVATSLIGFPRERGRET